MLKDFLEFYKENKIDIVKDKLAGKENSNIFFYLLEFGFWCTNRTADTRPNMELVYTNIISYEQGLLKKSTC